MANQSLSESCKNWGYDELRDFDNPVFQKQLKQLPESEQQQILMQKKLFWNCYEGNSNPISEGENPDPEDRYEEHQEETRKKQAKYIKDRGASFVFYQSFIEALEDINDNEFRTCIMALTDYGLYQKEEEYKGIAKMFMTMAKPQIDANERRKRIARQNGSHGGAPTGNNNARRPNST